MQPFFEDYPISLSEGTILNLQLQLEQEGAGLYDTVHHYFIAC